MKKQLVVPVEHQLNVITYLKKILSFVFVIILLQHGGLVFGADQAQIQLIESQIEMLNQKIEDQQRSVQLYENWGKNSSGVSNIMLKQSANNLLQMYQKQKMELENLKARLESGM